MFQQSCSLCKERDTLLLFRLVTMKTRALAEPVELTISIRSFFPPVPFPSHPSFFFFFFYFNSTRIHFAYCTYVTSFVPPIEGQCSRGTLKRREAREQRAEQTSEWRQQHFKFRDNVCSGRWRGGRRANAFLRASFIYDWVRACVRARVTVCMLVPLSQRASPCVCVALSSDTGSSGNPSRLPGQPAPTS